MTTNNPELSSRSFAQSMDPNDCSPLADGDEICSHAILGALGGRSSMVERLELELSRSQLTGTPVGLIFVDLDAFRRINDTLGHTAGDQLLAVIAQRVKRAVRTGDHLGRFAGDSYIIVAPGLDSVLTANALVRDLLKAVAGQVVLNGLPLAISATAGVALSDGTADADVLFQRADTALHRAKAEGRRMRIFDSSLSREATEKLQIESRLRGALDRGDMWLAYQPIVSSEQTEVRKVEALLRWKDDELGMLAPPLFLPIADHVGLMDTIGDFVLEQAISDRDRLAGLLGSPDLRIAVNLAPCQLMSSSLVPDISAKLARHGVDPEALVLEVVEDLLLSEASTSMRTLAAARAKGMKVALDDFGTGKGSLAHLQAIECDFLKIDKSFVDHMLTDHQSRAIVTATLHLADGFGLTAVAEGVETDEQRQFLVDAACDDLQGFYFARPHPIEAYEAGDVFEPGIVPGQLR